MAGDIDTGSMFPNVLLKYLKSDTYNGDGDSGPRISYLQPIYLFIYSFKCSQSTFIKQLVCLGTFVKS